MLERTSASRRRSVEPKRFAPAHVETKTQARTETETETRTSPSTRRHDTRRTNQLLHGPGGKRNLGQLSRAEGATLALHRPQLFGVGDLVKSIDRALEKHHDQASILEAVSGSLQKLLANPRAIDDALIRTSEERYTRTLLHRDPQKRFVVLLLAWAPGQASPIHDHECWGAVGVYRGALAETRYEKTERGLESGAIELARRGTVTTVDPPDTDLHTMSNPSREVTVTIHVYGRDMTEANVYDAATGAKTRKQITVDYVA